MNLGPLNRHARRAAARFLEEAAKAWPEHLVPVPESEWPPPRPEWERPLGIWRSLEFLAMLYAEPSHGGIELRRLTVNRAAVAADGHWVAEIAWDDLQRCKRETGHGDWYGVEVYPRERDKVHVANMRHLWLLAEPLPIGWFAEPKPER